MDENTAQDLLTVLRDVRALLRVSLREDIDQVTRDAFSADDAQIEAFKLLGEGKSYREIGEEVGASHTTVSRWVSRWREMGLVHPDQNSYLMSPEMLGV